MFKATLSVTTIISLLTVSGFANAHEFVCKNGPVTRTISVQHEVPGQELPCAVKYEKSDEGTTEFPWSASNTAGYCAEKADYLAERLKSFGWMCERTDSEMEGEESHES